MNKIKLPTPDHTPAAVLGSCLNPKDHAASDSLHNFMNIVAQFKIDFPFVNTLSRTAA